MDHTKQPLPDTPDSDVVDQPLRVSSLSAKRESPIREEVEEEVEEPDQTEETTIEQLAEDVYLCYQNATPLYETYFYKVVLAGNVDVVKRTVQYLETNYEGRVVSWLLDVGCAQHRKLTTPIKEQKRLQIVRWVVFGVTAFFTLLISPIFYCFHGMTNTLLENRKRFLSTRINLPMAFAAFSHSVEMVEYFMSKNVQASFTDKRHNNVFHYIADMSYESSSNAGEAFDVMLMALEDESPQNIKTLLYESQNLQGLSPMESAARYGSSGLLTKMMNCMNLITKTHFQVQPKRVDLKPNPNVVVPDSKILEVKVDEPQSIKVALLKEVKGSNTTKATEETNGGVSSSASFTTGSTPATTRVDFVDVTKYESHDLTKRSLLLRLIGSRNTAEISMRDLQLFQRCPVIGKWIDMKVEEMKRYVIGFHVLDIVVTILLISLLVFLRGSLPYQVQESQNFFNSYLHEVEARQEGMSLILKPDAMVRTVKATIQNKQLDWSLEHVNKEFVESVIKDYEKPQGPEDMVIDGNNISSLPNLTLTNNAVHIPRNVSHDWSSGIKDSIIEEAYKMTLDTSEKLLLRNLYRSTELFSQEFLTQYPDYPLIMPTTKNIDMLEDVVNAFFYSFEANISGQFVKPSEFFDHEEWRELFCPTVKDIPQEDFAKRPVVSPPPALASDICRWKSLVEMAEEKCKPDTPVQVYKTLDNLLRLYVEYDRVADVLIYIMLIFALGYIAIDTLEHLRFFYMCIQSNHSTLGMVLSVLTWRIPGSYYRKQLNIITYYVLVLHVCVQADVVAMYFSSALVAALTHQMLLIGLCIRFIMHVHSMRLFPWIGHFIITTFQMATNLIHFSTVLGVVIFIFGVIFHILIVDDNCPIRKMDGFQSVGTSMFSVFKLTFGHGEFDAYYSNVPAMLTYTLYMIICGLLLLNLIIAIMSNTATDLMTTEGKAVLGRLEWLNESLSVEYTVAALAGYFDRGSLYKNHARAGYTVVKIDKQKEPNVYIRVFYCPKLD